MRLPARFPKRALLTLVACVWLVATAAGLRHLWAYAYRPGPSGAESVDWPAETRITRDPARPTLVMFVHPMCPCSKASAEQLARVMARCADALAVRVVAIRGKNAPAEWGGSKLVKELEAIPGVTLTVDSDGVEAGRFGAKTSGHTCLYDDDGKLKFSGGITAARGHAGDNAGSDTIVAIVQQQPVASSTTMVFGCSLVDK